MHGHYQCKYEFYVGGGCMQKIFRAFLLSCLIVMPFAARADFDLETDTSDPLFLLRDDAILADAGLSYGHEDSHDILRMGLNFSYGLNDRLSISARTN